MLSSPAAIAMWLGATCLLSSSAAAWLWIVQRWRRHEELLPYEPRLPVPWISPDDLPPEGAATSQGRPGRLLRWARIVKVPHAILLFAAFMLLQVAGIRLAIEWNRSTELSRVATSQQITPAGPLPTAQAPTKSDQSKGIDPGEMWAMLIANSAVGIGFGVLVVIVLRYGRVGATWQDLGLSLRRLPYDLRVGLLGFVAVSVPVYALQGLLGYFVEGEHPIVKFVRDTDNLSSLLLAAVAAVLVAPLVEELLFRVVLQGWLESSWPRLRPGFRSGANAIQSGVANDDPLPAGAAWGPVVISSAVFALMHVGHGPDPIPLFVLALVLGYLYQRTHRVWASVTLHFSLNLCSLLMLWGSESMQAAVK